ncbi:MAG: hypothetical protein FJW66_00140 [Actinobacteria bacterium]|nr:hypothetical protein [Actinomycetota bacterium]
MGISKTHRCCKLINYKNKNKNLSLFNLLRYFFIFLFCVAVTGLFSCSSLLKKVEEVSSDIPFNYPGLRFETRVISAEEVLKNTPLVICFGDSVTFGWNVSYELSFPYLLEEKVSRSNPSARVINSGIGGNTVKDAYERLDRDIFAFNPDYVFINFGLNDGMLEKRPKSFQISGELFYEKNGSRYAPCLGTEEFEYYFSEIIKKIKEKNIKILVSGITPVSDFFPVGEETEYNEKQKEIYKVYNFNADMIAGDIGVDFIDMFQVFDSAGDLNSLLQEDGIHPNEKGLELISETLFKYFEKNYQD